MNTAPHTYPCSFPLVPSTQCVIAQVKCYCYLLQSLTCVTVRAMQTQRHRMFVCFVWLVSTWPDHPVSGPRSLQLWAKVRLTLQSDMFFMLTRSSPGRMDQYHLHITSFPSSSVEGGSMSIDWICTLMSELLSDLD